MEEQSQKMRKQLQEVCFICGSKVENAFEIVTGTKAVMAQAVYLRISNESETRDYDLMECTGCGFTYLQRKKR